MSDLIRKIYIDSRYRTSTSVSSSDFEVELHNRMTPEHYTKTLLHELWHVYQHVTGQLKDKYKKRLWKGVDHSKTDYEDQPWEVEANRMEELLYEEYTTYLSTSNLKL